MTQANIMELLKKSPNTWWSTAEIAHVLGIRSGNVCKSFKILRKNDFVDYKAKFSNYHHILLYKHKEAAYYE